MDSSEAASPSSWAYRRILFFILLFSFLTFLPALTCDFVNWDDPAHLLDNVRIRIFDLTHLKEIFIHFVNKTYIPLTSLTYAIEYHFFKFDPFVYHLDNVFLHLAVVGLVFVFALRMGLSLFSASLAALIFGIHPMHVESVVWVTGRKDVLYSFFYLLALNSYCHYLQDRRMRFYILVLSFGFLSILSKPMALSLPLILFLCDWFKSRRWEWGVILDKIPIFLYIVPTAALTYVYHARIPGVNPLESILTWIWTFTFYLQKFFIPFHLSPLYQAPQPVTLYSSDYSAALVIFPLFLFCLYLLRRNKLFLFAFFYYFLSIFFLLRFDYQRDLTVVADRFMYLPSLGWCLLMGVCLEKINLSEHLKGTWRYLFKFTAVCICTLLLFFLSLKTFQQCRIWKDSLSLWAAVIEHFHLQNNQNRVLAFAYNNHGLYYSDREIKPLALIYFNKAIENNPAYKEAFNNRGAVYLRLGRYDLAMTDFNKAIELDSSSEESYVNRGIVYIMLYQDDLALADFQKALKINPHYAKAYNNVGNYYLSREKCDLAQEFYEKALKEDPDYIDVFVNKGVLHQIKGEYDLAVTCYTQAIEREPSHHLAYVFRANAYLAMQKLDQAKADYHRALQLQPRDSFAYYKLSQVFTKKGNLKKAREELFWSQALGYQVDPKYLQELEKF